MNAVPTCAVRWSSRSPVLEVASQACVRRAYDVRALASHLSSPGCDGGLHRPTSPDRRLACRPAPVLATVTEPQDRPPTRPVPPRSWPRSATVTKPQDRSYPGHSRPGPGHGHRATGQTSDPARPAPVLATVTEPQDRAPTRPVPPRSWPRPQSHRTGPTRPVPPRSWPRSATVTESQDSPTPAR